MPRDPLSHRIIEKRRRDRMNNCLADLSRLIPSSHHKQGQGRVEKTEIIELAIKHIRMLQQQLNAINQQISKEVKPSVQLTPNEHHSHTAKFYMGFKAAQDEVLRFLAEADCNDAMDVLRRKIISHLENASKKFIIESIPPSLPGDLVTTDITDTNNQSGFTQQSSVLYRAPSSGLEAVGDNSLNLEFKCKDKHGRAQHQHDLIEPNNEHGTSTEGNASSHVMAPAFTYSNHMVGIRPVPLADMIGSDECVSDLSCLEQSAHEMMLSRDNVYKFKHNITQRFSQEDHSHSCHMEHHDHSHGQSSDSSSSSSSFDHENDHSHFKCRTIKQNAQLYGQGYSWRSYTSKMDHKDVRHLGKLQSDLIHPDKSQFALINPDKPQCVSDGCARQITSMNSRGYLGSSSIVLPGFILHPQGTHYMPISLQNINTTEMFGNSAEHNSSTVIHPVCIPVYFKRAVISMPNVTVGSHTISQTTSSPSESV